MSSSPVVLSYLDPLPKAPRRVLIAGTAGAGKTSLARQLEARLGLPHTEVDALYHGPDWTPRPEFVDDVTALARRPRWVMEWQYRAVRPLLAERADLLVWLDYPRALVMWRVIKRTVRRWALQEELWNGNREGNLWRSFTHEQGIIRWAWETHPQAEKRVRQLAASGADLSIVRLRSPAEAREWLARVAAQHGAHA